MGFVITAGAALAQAPGDLPIHAATPRDLYWLFSRYWWLLFPLGWAIFQMVKNWQRHNRAKTALEVLQSYASQGKDPPPELVAMLRQPDQTDERKNRQGNYHYYGWIPVFLFGGLTCGFALLAAFPPNGMPRVAGVFVALIMAGLCLGNLVALQAHNRSQNRLPPP